MYVFEMSLVVVQIDIGYTKQGKWKHYHCKGEDDQDTSQFDVGFNRCHSPLEEGRCCTWLCIWKFVIKQGEL